MRNKYLSVAFSSLSIVGLLFAFAAGASAASKEKVIYSFQGGSDGANPFSDLVVDAAGNLYGTTSAGGSGTNCQGGCGTVFELARTKNGWEHHVLYSFTGSPNDGQSPYAGLVLDGAGNLYGTTSAGGTAYCIDGSCGTVFELMRTKDGWKEQVLYSFDGSAGSSPRDDLVSDDKGNLYGTAPEGGINFKTCFGGCGTVFELTRQGDGSWTETTIYEFAGSTDGAYPSSAVVLDSAGNAYGTTYGLGHRNCEYPNGFGNVYELTPGSGGTWTESVLHDFGRGGGHGIYPEGGLLFDKTSHLYGLTWAGGDGLGTVFELYKAQKNDWQQAGPYRFYGSPDGSRPVDSLVMGEEGDLFGVTLYGGANGSGVVFELRRSNGDWRERVLHSFGAVGDAAYPQARLVFGPKGHLYGTTDGGGNGRGCNNGCGTVYEVTP